MPDNRRAWTEYEIVQLKSMAGKLPLYEMAAQLGRTRGATAVEASKLKLSLRFNRTIRRKLPEHVLV